MAKKFVLYKGHKWTKEFIKELINRKDEVAIKGLGLIYSHQTPMEQDNSTTMGENGLGFNSADAYILTNIYDFYKDRGFISKGQMKIVRKALPKYSGQILAHIHELAEKSKKVS